MKRWMKRATLGLIVLLALIPNLVFAPIPGNAAPMPYTFFVPVNIMQWLTVVGDAMFKSGRPWCDPLAFGAQGNATVSGWPPVGSGGTVDTAAFNNCAVTLKSLGGGVLYVPPAPTANGCFRVGSINLTGTGSAGAAPSTGPSIEMSGPGTLCADSNGSNAIDTSGSNATSLKNFRVVTYGTSVPKTIILHGSVAGQQQENLLIDNVKIAAKASECLVYMFGIGGSGPGVQIRNPEWTQTYNGTARPSPIYNTCVLEYDPEYGKIFTSGTTTSGSSIVTNIGSGLVGGPTTSTTYAGTMAAGMVVSGISCIPAGTTISSVDSSTQIHMSANATCSVTSGEFIVDSRGAIQTRGITSAFQTLLNSNTTGSVHIYGGVLQDQGNGTSGATGNAVYICPNCGGMSTYSTNFIGNGPSSLVLWHFTENFAMYSAQFFTGASNVYWDIGGTPGSGPSASVVGCYNCGFSDLGQGGGAFIRTRPPAEGGGGLAHFALINPQWLGNRFGVNLISSIATCGSALSPWIYWSDFDTQGYNISVCGNVTNTIMRNVGSVQDGTGTGIADHSLKITNNGITVNGVNY